MTEKWTLYKTTIAYHPFHIHVNPFHEVSINGVPQKAIDYRDTVPIPPEGTVVIRQRFSDFIRRFVIHCHILFHEDHGMLAPMAVAHSNRHQYHYPPMACPPSPSPTVEIPCLSSLRPCALPSLPSLA